MNETLLDQDTEDKVRMSASEAQALGEAALKSLGYSPEDAATITTHLVDASMWGYEFAGLPRILVIADRPEVKQPRQAVTIVKETPVSALMDGGNNVGYVSLPKCVDLIIDKVGKSGVAIVGLRNSWYAGRNAYYLEKIARAGYAVVYFGSSTPSVVPPGAKKKALGTNPWTVALPGKPNPFIFDIGTAAVMSGEVLLKSFLGESFDEIVGIDKDGKPTRVASEVKEGGIYPFGGHKGYGMSLVIQAMGLLGGARFRNGEVSDFGSLYLAFDPNLLMPLAQFTGELDELLTHIKSLPRQPGVSEIRIPSERGFHEREIRRRQGVLVNRHVVERLRQMVEG
jgi:LDH2 family malate/lactate/ureidoglycolate dehydrogenase